MGDEIENLVQLRIEHGIEVISEKCKELAKHIENYNLDKIIGAGGSLSGHIHRLRTHVDIMDAIRKLDT